MEVNLLKNLNHPNIVSYKTSFISMGLLVIVMEYCEGKDQIIFKCFYSWGFVISH